MRNCLPALSLAIACSPRPEAPPLALQGLLATEGGLDLWFTDPGTAPGEEQNTDLDDALIELIDAATTSLDLALYEFDLPGVVAAVEDAWDRGVDVRMVGDGDEVHDAGYEALAAAGVPMTLRPAGDRIMHHKFAVIDEQVVWTGSTNVSHNGVWRNNNHAVAVRSETLAAAYTHELEQMAGGEFGRGKTALAGPRTLDLADGSLSWAFSPTHDPVQVVVDAIDAADDTVAFMVFSFTHDDVVDAILRAEARGVAVLGIFDESQAHGLWSADETLAQAGIHVRIDGNGNASGFSGGKLHHKVLVVDPDSTHATVVTGSMNWSAAGTDDNDENLLLVQSPSLAAPMMAELCALAEVATPHPDATAPDPGVCDGLRPAGRVVLNEVEVGRGRSATGRRFVELVSRDAGPVDLTGWSLVDDAGDVRHTLGGPLLRSGGVRVVVGSASTLDVPGQQAVDGPLRIGGTKHLFLYDHNDVLVDAFDLRNAPDHGSLSRWHDGDPSAPIAPHATLTADAAPRSPGRRLDGRTFWREPAADVLVINEVMADPDGTDAGAEWVELVSLGPVPLDPSGWTLCDASDTCHTFGPPSLLPGESLVLCDRCAPDTGERATESGRLSLNNASETLTLRTPDGAVHATVSWTGAPAGRSLNRATDGDPQAALIDHTTVPGSMGDSSRGWRVDGTAWR